MPRFRTQATKDKFLNRMRKQRLKSITVLPSLVTILNGVCGFTAIVFASKGISAVDVASVSGAGPEGLRMSSAESFPYFAMSGYMILMAMIADMLDGRLARISKSTSSFGGQLDSLCDIISFGVAPAFLMVKLLEYELLGFSEMSVMLEHFLRRFFFIAAAAYVSCSAIRLARFNVENEEDESSHMSFIGLPTPAAAGVIISLVIFHAEALTQIADKNSSAYLIIANLICYSLPFLAIGLSILMVGRIRYPHVLNQYIRGKKPFAHFIRVLVFLALIIWSRQAALVIIFCGFAASGFLKWFYYKVIKKHLVSNYLRGKGRVSRTAGFHPADSGQ